MAVVQAIEVYRGEQVTLNFTGDASLVDITGWSIKFNVAKEADSPVKKIPEKTATILNGPARTFKVAIDAEDLALLKPGTYYWDAWRMDANEERVLALGAFEVLPVARLPLAS